MHNSNFNDDFVDSRELNSFEQIDLSEDKDILMEEILVNINTTPIGQVLKKIASQPEVRAEKVLGIRGQINQGQYNLNTRLDLVLDKVLEDLAT